MSESPQWEKEGRFFTSPWNRMKAARRDLRFKSLLSLEEVEELLRQVRSPAEVGTGAP
jgi:hypothetical protein